MRTLPFQTLVRSKWGYFSFMSYIKLSLLRSQPQLPQADTFLLPMHVTIITMLVVTAGLTLMLLGSLREKALWLFIFLFPRNEQMKKYVKHLAQLLGHKTCWYTSSLPLWYLNMLSCAVIIMCMPYLFHWILSSLELWACLSYFFKVTF